MGAASVDHRCVKTNDHTVAAGRSVDPARWQGSFDAMTGRIAGRLARVEPRRRIRRWVLGLLSDLPRKNCWTIAKWAGEATPDGMHHLLNRAKWDAEVVRDDLRDYVLGPHQPAQPGPRLPPPADPPQPRHRRTRLPPLLLAPTRTAHHLGEGPWIKVASRGDISVR